MHQNNSKPNGKNHGHSDSGPGRARPLAAPGPRGLLFRVLSCSREHFAVPGGRERSGECPRTGRLYFFSDCVRPERLKTKISISRAPERPGPGVGTPLKIRRAIRKHKAITRGPLPPLPPLQSCSPAPRGEKALSYTFFYFTEGTCVRFPRTPRKGSNGPRACLPLG
jgi:hypothetical protein